jgi:hypothetical protein
VVPAKIPVGEKFGRLTVLGRGPSDKHGNIHWLCRCECGKECAPQSGAVRQGKTVSCGCWNVEAFRSRATDHGNSTHPLYERHRAMVRRCHDARTAAYPNYGGRGITVCAAWRRDFLAFAAHIGPRPTKRHSLDRINNDRGYEPGNVRWAEPDVQQNNRRGLLPHVAILGETKAVTAWAKEPGAQPRGLIYKRLIAGWDAAFAVFLPSARSI